MTEPMPLWYKHDQYCAYLQGSPSHDIENCYLLKHEFQQLVRSRIMSFEDRALNVKANPLPIHGNSSVNMVDGYPGEYKVYDVRHIRRYLVELHKTLCEISECEHDHDGCIICSVNPHGCVIVKRDIKRLVDDGMYDSSKGSNRSVSPLVIRLAGTVPYASDKVMPYKYDATMIKDEQEVPLPEANSVVSIADVVKVSLSGRLFSPVFPKDVENVVIGKKAEAVVPLSEPINTLICQCDEFSGLKIKDDNDEVLRLVKKSEFNVVEQLLQTPTKISVLSLLMNFEAHHEALQKVLEKTNIEHDVIVDQFDHIVANITSCNNMSFYDEDLLEEGRNHNLDLRISMNCKEDALSNILVDTGSSLNVLPKSTLARISYQGEPMRYNGVIVNAFDGRPWIHEADDITSTLNQKLKFFKNGKLVIIGGEKALMVSHLSSFMYVKAKEVVGTPLQALSVANVIQKTGASISYLKDAQDIVKAGDTDN
ncbi:uncharacterized protein LOC127137744 [Lathyrus oleraceus]|uniref:uncharacterized protein LOC127137744 n=1 Tax=Pisum sativum TaxID=3888 RepID=UPI0021CE511C|nr:uncharacterized protein LOC127137744 [Pisum sativum]